MDLDGLKSLFPDAYTRRARLAPPLLVALPVALAFFSVAPEKSLDWESIWAIIVWCGGAKLLWEVGRDQGVKKQEYLFDLWGGRPTTQSLRYKNAPNRTTLERRHKKLQELLPDIVIPTAAQEENDPKEADEVYKTCTDFLKSKTRDKKKFPLIFKENCSYGFRRNLWGMKPIGITTTAIGFAIIIVFILYRLFAKAESIPVNLIFCGLINLILLLLWLFWFKPEWVRIPAEAYAERLLEAIERL